MVLVHASCVALGDLGLLLRGRSGAGKSDLALRLIDEGATLVADDQVALSHDGPDVIASAPAALAGLIEARGVGILCLPHIAACRLRLVADLVRGGEIERLPEPGERADIAGRPVACVRIAPFEASAPAKLRLALSQISRGQALGLPRPAGAPVEAPAEAQAGARHD